MLSDQSHGHDVADLIQDLALNHAFAPLPFLGWPVVLLGHVDLFLDAQGSFKQEVHEMRGSAVFE